MDSLGITLILNKIAFKNNKGKVVQMWNSYANLGHSYVEQTIVFFLPFQVHSYVKFEG